MPVAAEQQVKGFVDKFDAKNRALIRSVRRALRKRLPTAHELVYDNYNFFVIGYGATERPSDAILSIAAAANGVRLFFLHGKDIPDPQKLLRGAGKQARSIQLESAAVLERRALKALIAAAIARSRAPFRRTGRGDLIIRSVSKKQRPRRSD